MKGRRLTFRVIPATRPHWAIQLEGERIAGLSAKLSSRWRGGPLDDQLGMKIGSQGGANRV